MASIAVIGAGAGGMAAAARLSIKGHTVEIFEQSSAAGGKLAGYSRDGFVFDTGPSLFTLPAVYRDLFIKTGRSELDDLVDIQAVDPAFAYHWSDGAEAVLPGSGPGVIASALGDGLGGRAADDWRALMKHASEVWRLTRRNVLESPIASVKDLLPLAKNVQDIRKVAPWKTLRSVGKGYLHDPRLVTYLDRFATYTGSDPRRAPAALVTVPYVEQAFGAWHIAGGVHKLAEQLYARCLERDIPVHLDTPVSRITTDQGHVTGVVAGGTHYPADIVVANADAALVYRDLLDIPARGPLRTLEQSVPSFSGFVLLLAVDGHTPGIHHHNVWFPDNYDAEFDALFAQRPTPATDPTIYACVPDDPAMHPAGSEAWFILINAPRHGHGQGMYDWEVTGVAESYATHILSTLAERGMDIRDRIRWMEIRTPADIEHNHAAPGGAIYGSSSNGWKSAFLRAANISPVDGLYLVGGSAHPGGGLPLVGMSADIVATAIGRDD